MTAMNFLEELRHSILPERVSIIIPCYNEAQTLGAVIAEAKKSWLAREIIVVDDGSTDGSAAIAEEAAAKVIRHRKNLGKGRAIMSGAKAAKNDVLVFIDADLENFSSGMVNKLAQPVLSGSARMCKATFGRDGGRITELVAKPLLELIYPEAVLSQPLSGQFCIRKSLLHTLDVSLDWGIDISIVLSALRKGEKIAEVDIGELRHKHRSLPDLAKTSREVVKAILQNAGFHTKKYRLIVFDFDHTLIPGSSILEIAARLGIRKKVESLRQKFKKGIISERELTESIARALKGFRVDDFEKAASAVQPAPYAHQTLASLKRMGYRLAVVSFAFHRAITSLFQPGNFDAIICPKLHSRDGIFTGRVTIPRFRSEKRVFSKGRALCHLARRFKTRQQETVAVGNTPWDDEMFAEAGFSIVVDPKKRLSLAEIPLMIS